jgi:hypothetical protein
MLRQSMAVASALLAFVALASLASGQQNDEMPVPVSIRVVDPAKCPVPGARVTIVGSSQSLKLSQVTNSSGLLPVVLRPDSYDITVTGRGFAKTVAHLQLQKNSSPSFEIKMWVGSSSGPEVTASGPSDKAAMDPPCANSKTP